MKSIKDNYIVIQGWMITDLELKGNDLLVYAIIYGFSQDEESEFTGSLNYLATWCNSTKSGIQKNLKNLIDRGLIKKKEHYKNDVKYCSYSCIVYNKVVQGIQQSCIPPIQQSCTNNIDINNIKKDNIDKCVKSKTSKKDKILKMVEKKCLEYDIEDEVIDKLYEFYIVLIDNNKLVSQQKIEADLSNLAKVNLNKQLRTIQEALNRGWQSLNTEWLDNIGTSKQSRNTLINHEGNSMSQEEHIEQLEEMKKNSNHKF